MFVKTDDDKAFVEDCFKHPLQVVPENVLNIPLRIYMDMSLTRGLDVHFNNLLNYYTEEEVLAYIQKRWEKV